MNGQQLISAKKAIADKNPELLSTLSHLVEKAEAALDEGPFTVMNKTVTPPSGDKHDYMSLGPYWWPDPDTEDGLPYIRRDGQINPDSTSDASDKARIARMAGAVHTLALAYYFTDRQKYAEHAALLLRTWFLDEDTKMNPHLRYGQAIPGRVDGRGIGIIDTSHLLRVVDAAGLLVPGNVWTDADHEALKVWFRAYLTWLRTSEHGREESRQPNNHATYYDAQVAGFALFVGDRKTADKVLALLGKSRIYSQIEADGRQPRELARTLSFGYSIGNLKGMFHLAGLGEHVGVDLWHFKAANNASIRRALDYLAPYTDAEKEWPHQQITEIKRAKLLPLLRQGFHVYKDPEYITMIGRIPKADRESDLSRLLYPESICE